MRYYSEDEVIAIATGTAAVARLHNQPVDGTARGVIDQWVKHHPPTADVERALAYAADGLHIDGLDHKQFQLGQAILALGGRLPPGVDRGTPA